MFENSLKLLNMNGVKFEKGLTHDKLEQIERVYRIKFPESLKEFLMMAVPVSKGFYNWGNIQNGNVQFIKKVINRPVFDVYDMAEEIDWCDSWGEQPQNEKTVIEEVRKRLKKAPKLLPIYAHRYMPMVLDNDPPIVSIHGTDIIYYGENLEDYFEIEFGKKAQNTIRDYNITPVPFWSDIM